MPSPSEHAVAASWTRRSAAYEQFYARYGDDRRAAWADAARQWLGPGRRRVLDVGCGTGFLTALLAELGHEVVGIDLSEGMLPRARAEADRRGVEVALHRRAADQVDGLGTFDVVTARYVLWTLPDPGAALAAWREILQPHGTLLVADGLWRPRRLPLSPRRLLRLARDRADLGPHLPHWRGLHPDTTVALVRDAGFASPERVEDRLDRQAWPEAAGFAVVRATRPDRW
ncbi:class I SAM-dependent methyltransferase [Actinomycetospora sp. OC33-EN08]|uniref:Class I SAM-dependent methyltransferase n=1 Tax=Actinomycetospora aurantiaca TaxID=3129233 RepID=A0ABU8ML85_9PSEU